MYINNVNESAKTLNITIPLTNGTGKPRIKKRSFFNEYGLPVSTKSEPFSLSCYVEWQIGYDVGSVAIFFCLIYNYVKLLYQKYKMKVR